MVSDLTGSTGVLILLPTVMGLLVGGLMLRRRASQRGGAAGASQSSGKRRLPRHWPLNPRPLTSSHEHQTWQWLRAAFPDHHVMLKLPLTRFTMPRRADEGREWFDLLSNAYCSFTLCDDKGRVIGCVDLLGPRGLSRGNRQLKQMLLAQCGIGYWVLSSESLPEPQHLRTEFLGTVAAAPPPPTVEQNELDTVRHQLHEMLNRNRHHRWRQAAESGDAQEADQLTPWPQADSFLGTLDSRRSPLARV